MAESFESFCERCGTRQTPERTAAQPALAGRILRGLLGGNSSELDLSGPGEGQKSGEPFLRVCLACRGYNCPACWNNEAGFCQECVPLPNAPEQTIVAPSEPADAPADSGAATEPVVAEPTVEATLEWPEGDLAQKPKRSRTAREHVVVEAQAEAEPLAVEPEPAVAEPEPAVAAPEPVVTEPEPVLAEAEPEPVVESVATAEERRAFVHQMTADVDVTAILDLPAVSNLLAAVATPPPVEAGEPEPVVAEAEPEPVVAEAEPEPVVAEAEPEPVVAEAEPAVEPWVEWPSTAELPQPFTVPPAPSSPFSQPHAHLAAKPDASTAAGAPLASAPIAGQLPPGASLPHPAAIDAGGRPALPNLPADLFLAPAPQTRECFQCQLPISAKAHFCRRCGSKQDTQPH